MLSVGADPVVVERQLRSGGLRCPQCGQRLAPWGHAAPRFVRQAAATVERIRPRRVICSSPAGCGRSHVLLPRFCLESTTRCTNRRPPRPLRVRKHLSAKSSAGRGCLPRGPFDRAIVALSVRGGVGNWPNSSNALFETRAGADGTITSASRRGDDNARRQASHRGVHTRTCDRRLRGNRRHGVAVRMRYRGRTAPNYNSHTVDIVVVDNNRFVDGRHLDAATNLDNHRTAL